MARRRDTLAALALSIAITSCASPQEVCAEKSAKLDSMRREAEANVIRQQGECQAVATEFPGDKMILNNCMDTLRLVVDTAQNTQAFVSKRLSEPDMQGCLPR